jgi:hypothetical protein
MKKVAVSRKAKCLSMIDEIERTKRPIAITRRGKPVVEVRPISPEKSREWIGSMKGRIKFLGDIVGPVIDLNDIEALRD